jgi:hypothetical protein
MQKPHYECGERMAYPIADDSKDLSVAIDAIDSVDIAQVHRFQWPGAGFVIEEPYVRNDPRDGPRMQS